MPHLNNCNFIGHVGRATTSKSNLDGSKVWKEFSIAVDTGTIEKPETMWVTCRGFGKMGERFDKVNKGDAVYVSGKIKASAYQRKQDGQAACNVSLLVNEFSWLRASAKSEPVKISEYDLGAATTNASHDPFSDESVPF